MSGSVSSLDAVVICTSPTTSSSGLVSTNLCVSIGGANSGAGGAAGGGASTTAAGWGTGGEPSKGQPPSATRLPPNAAASRHLLTRTMLVRLRISPLTLSILEEYWLIGQLVCSRLASREMLSQKGRDPRHRCARP